MKRNVRHSTSDRMMEIVEPHRIYKLQQQQLRIFITEATNFTNTMIDVSYKCTQLKSDLIVFKQSEYTLYTKHF